MKRIVEKLIMLYMQHELNKLRKSQETPYIFLKGTRKDFPKYLMYTDDFKTRNEMISIN